MGAAERMDRREKVSASGQRLARILVVEDQEDVRRMLTTALELEGHQVEEAADAVEGLKRLREARYNLVLSDYAMPGGTGTWMLHEATRQGLMDDTVALIVTAHPNVGDLRNIEVVNKPLDMDLFLDQVKRILAASRGDDDEDTGGQMMARRRQRAEDHRIEFVLYVSSASPASIQARRNLERLLEGYAASQVKLSVCDLGREPLAGEADRVAFTPTLVKRYPEPRMWVLGNLRETALLEDLLRACGVEARGVGQ